MCVIRLSPEETAADAAAKLRQAAQDMARAQAELLAAADTLAMFAHNFRVGHYQERAAAATILTEDQLASFATTPA